MANGRSVEKTLVGYEGFLDLGLIIGGSGAFGRCVVQVPGHALWLSKTVSRASGKPCCATRSLITQLMETVACNSLHAAEQRVIRWLPTDHDSVSGDRFIVAEVPGLRRATVSAICSELQSEGLLEYPRRCYDPRWSVQSEQVGFERHDVGSAGTDRRIERHSLGQQAGREEAGKDELALLQLGGRVGGYRSL